MKMLEKDDIKTEAIEKFNETVTGEDGVERTIERERPKALSLQFMSLMMFYLHDRVARNWKYFDHYLETILAFAIHAPEDLENDLGSQDNAPFTKDCEAY